MKILISDPIAEEGKELLKTRGFEVDEKTGLTEDELVLIIPHYDGIIVRSATRVTRRVIEAATNLKVIGRAGVGLDNIDLDAAKERDIRVFNAPGGTTISVAELTMGMIIACTRSIPEATLSIKSGKWEKKKFVGRELYGKTLGIVGLGRIGKAVAERALAFGMRVIAYDIVPQEFRGIQMVTFEELLKEADIITLHIPISPTTRYLISDENIKKMKDGVVIINCARGGLVNEEALARALKSGKVSCAALDTYEKEPPSGSPITEFPNVVLTPHIGGQTREGQVRASVEIAKKVADFLISMENA